MTDKEKETLIEFVNDAINSNKKYYVCIYHNGSKDELVKYICDTITNNKKTFVHSVGVKPKEEDFERLTVFVSRENKPSSFETIECNNITFVPIPMSIHKYRARYANISNLFTCTNA